MENKKTAFEYKQSNILRGAIIYAMGDTIAALLLGQFSLYRLLGIALIGATVYAFEIPNYFRWIDRKVGKKEGLQPSLQRTALALLYFNPLWIARHLIFIKLVSGQWATVGWSFLVIGFWSFVINIPVSVVANFLIQNKVSLKWRFLASAVFSGLMAIYYALSETFFS